MSETAVAIEKVKPVLAITKRQPPPLTVAGFIEKYANIKDGFKYEFVNGIMAILRF